MSKLWNWIKRFFEVKHKWDEVSKLPDEVARLRAELEAAQIEIVPGRAFWKTPNGSRRKKTPTEMRAVQLSRRWRIGS